MAAMEDGAFSPDQATANTKPDIKTLQEHVISYVAPKWLPLGFALFDEKKVHKLNIIESNHKQDVVKCCLEMFREWLRSHSNATWSQLVEALKSQGVNLISEAEKLDDLIAQLPVIPQSPLTPQSLGTASSSDDFMTQSSEETLDFATYEDVSLAFSDLFSRFQEELNMKNGDHFKIIRNACIHRADQKVKKLIKKAGDIDGLFELFAENKPYCNWLNMRYLEVIAGASRNSKLVNLTKNYKKFIYSKTLGEVWGYIPHHKVRSKYYSKLRTKFHGKDPDDVTVEELQKMCDPYLVGKIAERIATIERGSLKITWLIPTDIVYETYLSALMIPQQLRLDDYLQIGDWVVHHPLHVLQNLQKDYWWILPSTLLIGYYHSLLMRNISTSLVMDKMCSQSVLSPHDQAMILAGHSIPQRSWSLLECVRSMKIQDLVKFCEFVQEILPEVALQLMAALDVDIISVTGLQSYTPDERSLALKNLPTACRSPSSLHILFLDVIDQVKKLLQWYNMGLLTELLKNLMASEAHKINLFSDSYVANLSNFTGVVSMLKYLSFLFTWSDHSILRALVSCSPEAIQLLDEFDCFLDPSSTIVSYPIDVYSLSMAPSEDSSFTLLAIRSDRELWQCSLQDVFNIRSILVELCEITQHCLQLVAIQSNPTIVFWNIPKCVVKLICTNLLEHTDDLCSLGIVEATVYPKQLIFTGDDIVVGSFNFLTRQEEYQTSVDATLNNSQEADDKEKENLLKEYEKLKENTEKDIMIKFEKIRDKLKIFNSELEKLFKKILPGDKTSQLIMGSHREKDPLKQIECNLDYLEKSVEHLDQVHMEYIKQQKVQLQYQQDLKTLKLELETQTNKANKKINYLKSELSKSKQMVEQFQEATEKAKERESDKPMEEEHEKVKDSIEKDTAAKVLKILQDRMSFKLGKEFKQAFPEYKSTVEAHEEITTVQQLEDKLDHFVENVVMFFNLKQQEVQSQYHQDLESKLESKMEEANEKISNFKIEFNKISEQLESTKKAMEENVLKLGDCNLELEKKFKQIIVDYETIQVEGCEGKDTMQQLDYNLDFLKKLIKQFDKAQFEFSKQKQSEREVELQDQIDNLESQSEIKEKKLKKLEDDNRILLKRLRENKTDKPSATSKTDNVIYPTVYGKLGSGLYGEVHMVDYKSNRYAGKIIHKEVLSRYPKMSSLSMSELQNQLEIKCKSRAGDLSHPNVEQFIEIVLSSADDGFPMILTELLPNSLTVHIDRYKETIYVNKELDLCNDMSQGMEYLHSRSLIHGNLHGNNILISRDGHAKIADYLCPLLFNNVDVDSSSGYLAPEVFQANITPSPQSNIFTLGVLFLQVITKHPPQSKTKDGSETQHNFAGVSSHHPLLPLIQQCLQTNERNRPPMAQVRHELAKLIKENDSPQRMAYKLLYTTEHKPFVETLASGRQQNLQCISCEKMPAPMFWGYAVLSNESEVYVTGGNSHNDKAVENVFRFSMLLNQWDKLPATGLHHSVPVILKNKLTLFGGRRPGSRNLVNTVITYDDGWVSKYPDMIHPRYRPGVVTFGDYVIVMGGRIRDRSTVTNTIEVMNFEREQKWIKLVTCLPEKMFDMQPTVSRDHVWIIGFDDGSRRSNKVYSIAVNDLISNPTQKHSFDTIRYDTLYYKMVVVPNSDPPVVLGGDNWRKKPTSAVVVFDHKTGSWSEVASLSSVRAYFSAVTVGKRGLLIIGGSSETKDVSPSCLQTVELYYIE